MFNLRWTKEANGEYRRLRDRAEKSLQAKAARGKTKSSKDVGRFKQVHKTVKLLAENPRHPGLRTHQFRSLPHPYRKDGKVFEAYAQGQTPGSYRVFWCYGPGEKDITILAITPHP
jgi:hypothetical protein